MRVYSIKETPNTLKIDNTDEYWEPGKYDRETTTKLGSDPNLPVNTESLSPELQAAVKYFDLKELSLSSSQLRAVIRMLNRNILVFAQSEYDLGRFSRWKHKIDTGNNSPIKCKPRRLSHTKLNALRKILKELIKCGFIRPSRSDWGSAIVMVPKKNGTWRMCQDYRPLNAVSTCCQFPLPRIDDMLHRFRGMTYFTALDLMKGFHQIPMDEGSIPKTAFVTPLGQYENVVMPFGLHSAPATFQAAMQEVLAGLEHKSMVYVDDIIIFSKNFEDHVRDVEEVLQRLIGDNLKIGIGKCEFFRTKLLYLGFVVSREGIRTDPKKVSAVKDMPMPECTLELETFLGKAGYYSRFVKNYSKIAQPLMRLKQKDVMFQMGGEERKAFRALKEALCEAPVLKHPDFSKRFYISTDASGYGLGAVLSQKYEDGEHPIKYASRTLKDAELRYSATEREALAVKWACREFAEYVEGIEFTIFTDHQALLALPQKAMTNRRLEQIAHQISEFRCEIVYRPGKENTNADTLSRYPVVPCKGKRSKEVQTNASRVNKFDQNSNFANECPKFKPKRVKKEAGTEEGCPQLQKENEDQKEGSDQETKSEKSLEGTQEDRPEKEQVSVIKGKPFKITPPGLQRPVEAQVRQKFQQIVHLQNLVPVFQYIREYLTTGNMNRHLRLDYQKSIELYFLDKEDRLCRVSERGGAQICIPPELRTELIYYAHSVPSSGHFGIAKTVFRLQKAYWWPGMAGTVARYILSCPFCRSYKPPTRTPREFLGDEAISKYPWQRLHLDIWKPSQRPTLDGNVCVLGIVDAFTKFIILIPMPDETASSIVNNLIKYVITSYGMPEEILSDRAPDFRKALRDELFEAYGVKRRLVTPYRPQANGLIERVFRTIKPMVAILSHKSRTKWDRHLMWVAYAYNTAYHHSVKSTPFELMFGREPDPIPEGYEDFQENKQSERRRQWSKGFEVAHKSMEDRRKYSKHYYDTVRARPQNFAVGDVVLLRVMQTPKGESVPKLYPRYVGPYRVTNVVGPVLYCLPLYGNISVARAQQVHSDRAVHCEDDYPNIHPLRHLMVPFPRTIQGLETETPEPDRNVPVNRRRKPVRTQRKRKK